MISRLRFVILQNVLVAGLVALWLSGYTAPAFAGHGKWFVAAVLAIAAFGLLMAGARRFNDARWIQDSLPVIAVIGMQAGILTALAVMGHSLMSGGDTAKAVGAFFAAISTALYVSIAALGSYLWLKLSLRLTDPRDDA